MSAARGNSARAETAAELPDAASVIQQMAPSPAPDLTFTDAKGKPLSLANYRGSGLVVNIWATWCIACVAELPSFVAISQTLAKSKILILPISVDFGGAQVVADYYRRHQIKSLPLLVDPDGNVAGALNVPGIPVTIIVNPAGQLTGRRDGGANWNTAGSLALIERLAGQASGNTQQPT